MKTITISTDGNTSIPEAKNKYRQKASTSVYIHSNIDSAVITFGTFNDTGAFKGFLNGEVDVSAKLNHGATIELVVNIDGITANPVKIGVSE